MMLGGLQEPVPVRVFSLEPSTVLQVDYEQAVELTLAAPGPARPVVEDLRRAACGSTTSGSPRPAPR